MCLGTEWPDTWNHKTSRHCLLHLEALTRKETGRIKCTLNWKLICLPGNSDSSLFFSYSCEESPKWTSYPTVTRQINEQIDDYEVKSFRHYAKIFGYSRIFGQFDVGNHIYWSFDIFLDFIFKIFKKREIILKLQKHLEAPKHHAIYLTTFLVSWKEIFTLRI